MVGLNRLITLTPRQMLSLLTPVYFTTGIIDLPENIKNCKNLEEIDASVNPIGKYVIDVKSTNYCFCAVGKGQLFVVS